VNVESVAWASERKNVLSMMFLLLALHAYGWYARKPALGRYAVVGALFCCGLMSKPQVITFPFVLLLWDYWPLGRFRAASSAPETAFRRDNLWSLVVEKAPLLLLSLVSAVVTVQAQKAGGAIHSSIIYPFWLRAENAIASYSRYIGKAVWPVDLSPLYPHPLDLLRTWQVLASAALLIVITAVVNRYRQRGHLVTGWFWFLGTLVPMIGLIQVGEQAMADRYAYLPFVGLFIAGCWEIGEQAEKRQIATTSLAIPAGLVLVALSFLTYRQIGIWRDSETLWSYALRVSSVPNHKAHLNLAIAYDQQGRYDDAIIQFRQSIDPHDDDPKIHLGIGIYDQKHGHVQEAIDEYENAIRLTDDPGLKADAFSNMGSAHRSLRDFNRAQADFAAALRLDPKKPMALIGAGLLAQRSGDLITAENDYSDAISFEPSAVGYFLLSQVLVKSGDPAQAKTALEHAKQLSSDWNETQRAALDLLKF